MKGKRNTMNGKTKDTSEFGEQTITNRMISELEEGGLTALLKERCPEYYDRNMKEIIRNLRRNGYYVGRTNSSLILEMEDEIDHCISYGVMGMADRMMRSSPDGEAVRCLRRMWNLLYDSMEYDD